MQKKRIMTAAVILGVSLGIAAFHLAHHVLYCRYRGTPGKSHCAVCGHRRICSRVHHKKGVPEI